MVSPLRRSAGKNGTRALRDAVGCRPVTNAPTTDAGRRSQAAHIPDQRSVPPAVLVLRNAVIISIRGLCIAGAVGAAESMWVAIAIAVVSIGGPTAAVCILSFR